MGSDCLPRRLKLVVRGAVQGVGFRPFVFRLARRFGLHGFVCNSGEGVVVEAEGREDSLQQFLTELSGSCPARAVILSIDSLFTDVAGYHGFEIRESLPGAMGALVSPDIAMCMDCRREMADPDDRRYRYPFINCMHCGPRYSMMERLPYDRIHTSMRAFRMCGACQREYDDPQARRFHAQANACPACGPRLALWDARGQVLAGDDGALQGAVAALSAGKIVAVKGIGGFHLLVDAFSDAAVMRLRERKHRLAKPLALMCHDMAAVRDLCMISPMEERLLVSPQAPIVLLRRNLKGAVALSVAPGNPYLGIMLAYTPLHQLLLEGLARAVVATSGNMAEETICIDERDALKRLGCVADLFLVHDRAIVRPVDDSLVRVICGTEQVLRRSRGYAPLPVGVSAGMDAVLAVGGHLKNAVALAKGKEIFISQHIGDLDTSQSGETFAGAIHDLGVLLDINPRRVACDGHPDYHSTRHAHAMGIPVHAVLHHEAHVFSCMADNALLPPVLGVAWDGSGSGDDGTLWGGEFFVVDAQHVRRFAHFEPFCLPGGDAAVREPRRALAGALFAAWGVKVFERPYRDLLHGFTDAELLVIKQMLEKRINTPATSSVGRRFDALAAFLGLTGINRFEGQAAMALEFMVPENASTDAYAFRIMESKDAGVHIVQAPVWDEVWEDVKKDVPAAVVSAKFHRMLVEAMVQVAKKAGIDCVALTGGCFQNRYLTEHAVRRLREEGFKPYWHQRVPPNDGGLALGQVVAAMRAGL